MGQGTWRLCQKSPACLPVPNGWMRAGEEENSQGPHQPESPSWFFTVGLKSLPAFKLNTVPGDESELLHLEHPRGDQRWWTTAVTYQTRKPRALVYCLFAVPRGDKSHLRGRHRPFPLPCSGACGSALNTSVLESFMLGQHEEVYRPATTSKQTGKSGFKSQEL